MWQRVKRRFSINQKTKSEISIFYIEKHIWLHSYHCDEEKLLEDFSEMIENQLNKKMFNSKKKINFLQPGIKKRKLVDVILTISTFLSLKNCNEKIVTLYFSVCSEGLESEKLIYTKWIRDLGCS